MGGTIAPRGADLAGEGVSLAELPEGTPVGCRVGHDAVVAVRTGTTVSVLDAACTHYGADLAEGLVVDGTLRCPWHHACFALASGATTHAPALNDLGRWAVVRNGERFFARERAEIPRKTQARGPAGVAVIGAGAAGAAAVETLRTEGYDGPITWIGRESPVDRPNLSKDYLAGTAPEEWLPLRDDAFYSQQSIDTRFGREAVDLELSARSITLDDGARVSFEALILAPGARPIRLPIPGADLPHVHLLRTLADCRALIAAATGARRAVVLGASFVGLETAFSLRQRGLEVDVAAPETTPLERMLGPEVGAFLRRVYEEHGVRFHLGQTATSMSVDEVTLSDGSKLPAEVVVMGVGVRPDVALAERAGLKVDNGIVVDDRLLAAPGVFVAGDAARHPDLHRELVRIEHWVVAMRQGRAAARNVLGANEAYRSVPFFWSAHGDLSLRYVGRAVSWDHIDRVGSFDEQSVALAYRQGGRTLAVLTLGRDDVALEAERALERGDENALRALVPPG
jgi:NADPH-dependent 2,4-dienoyl-CoA reductase/sulfur reductase-like enzyme/nitrite reductase/ring-hydroxylating ferredoxin subunit